MLVAQYLIQQPKIDTKEARGQNLGLDPTSMTQNFDFEQELSQLPFPVNMGEVNMNELQQKRFLELIYDNQSVFSLCDEDLGLCDHLKHTIPMTTMDRPIYLPHRMIPVQLQAEVHKCLDTWLKQGIIRPSQSPCTCHKLSLSIKKLEKYA